jgi:hypothetical protein
MKKLPILFVAIVLATFAAVPVAAQRVRLRSQTTPNCGVNSISKFADIYGEGNVAVVGSYSCRGAFIFDITNPDAPVLASWYNPGGNQQFLEAVVVNGRGYFGSGNGGGVHVVDLSNPYSPTLLGIINPANGTAHDRIHEMMVIQQEGRTYLIENYNLLSSSAKIIKFIDVTNPAAATLKWDLNPTDSTWVHAMHVRGNKMYLSGWGGKVEIYNIGNLTSAAPSLLGAINGNSTNHSTWTSEDGNYLYSCRETLDGDLRVYDVRDPAQPLLVRSIKAGDLGLNAISPHNPVVMGNYLYVSWYQAGVQVFDISSPANPVRVGQYDGYELEYSHEEAEKEMNRLNLEPWDIVCGSERLQSALPTSYNGTWAVFPFLGQNKVLAGDLKNGLQILDATGVSGGVKNVVSDFDGDRKTDLSVFSPGTSTWKIESSQNGTLSFPSWGVVGDRIVAGDYDGDGKADIAVWRPSNGTWYIWGTTAGLIFTNFGVNGDIPVPADYDADGKTDIAVWRPSDGSWYIKQSTIGYRVQRWGVNGDKVMAGDFEGDGKADMVVWRPSTGEWWVLQSSSSGFTRNVWGVSGDIPVLADFDGDGRSEFVIFRPSSGTWYVLNPVGGGISTTTFGVNGDVPIPADFDGDGKSDITVYRPSNNVWYRIGSADNNYYERVFGQPGDDPSPRSVQPQ